MTREPVAVALVALVALVACSFKSSPAQSGPPLPAADTADSGVPWNPDEIVPAAAFTDFTAEDATSVQSFLERSPYGGASFLATYQSDGVLYPQTVTNAASTYRINPIVLLVAVEATGALVSYATYPQSPSGVDYVFGCGCSVPSVNATCAPQTAGLDVQLGCYADALRTSLDQIAATGQTSGRWGPGKSATTLDGVTVIPADASTAALYQYDPVAGHGATGGSLFANIWVEYTQAFAYSPPAIADTGATAQIGDGCISAADCAVGHAICATGSGYPGGLCTSQCTGSCAEPDAFCADFTQGGFCLSVCSPTNAASCRAGYACAQVQPSGVPPGTSAAYVCAPP